MKNVLNNIREFMNDKNNPNRKTILFFGFYLVFFLVIFGIIIFGGDADYLHQEYEMGNSTENPGVLCYNCVYDYKIIVDGVLYDYYGKKNENIESFKYNNYDYYRDQDEFFVYKDLWVKTENPYQFYELLDYEMISSLMKQATLISKSEEENQKTLYHYLISSNTLNQILYYENTDYDEEADSFDMIVDSYNNIESITYQLNHFCMHRENCQSTLKIEMSFEMFGNVKKIDSPIE